MRRAAEYILRLHGDRLRALSPPRYANYRAVAAINAARLGDLEAARTHLWAALRAMPTRGRTWCRLLLTLMPPLAVRFWRRHGDAAAPETVS
jgi:hypothetical protein